MGVIDNATVGRLSYGGATRRVLIFARLGYVADPEAGRLRIYVERADVFPACAEALPATYGGPFDSGMITGQGMADWIGFFPRLHALSTDQGVVVRQAWYDAWVLPLPEALRDQRVAELINLQELLADRRLSEAAQDAWVWIGPIFTNRAAYRLLRDQEYSEDPLILQSCCLVWKRRLPLKIKVSAWLLLRRRLMTRSRLQRMVPGAPVECPLCARAVEDCQHLFFVCPSAQIVWQATGVGRLVATSEEAFWRSLGGGTFSREVEWQTIFVTL